MECRRHHPLRTTVRQARPIRRPPRSALNAGDIVHEEAGSDNCPQPVETGRHRSLVPFQGRLKRKGNTGLEDSPVILQFAYAQEEICQHLRVVVIRRDPGEIGLEAEFGCCPYPRNIPFHVLDGGQAVSRTLGFSIVQRTAGE